MDQKARDNAIFELSGDSKMIRTTIIGGILFLVPIVILTLILGKAFDLSMKVAGPVNNVVPIEGLIGVIFVNAVAVLLILIVCYIAGLMAKREFLKDKVGALDSALIEIIPVYAFVKTMVSSVAKVEGEVGTLIPVVVAFDDHALIAFEVERNDTHAVVYLPGSPSPWSGSTVVVETERVTQMDLKSHEATKTIQLLGRGSLKKLPTLPASGAFEPQIQPSA